MSDLNIREYYEDFKKSEYDYFDEYMCWKHSEIYFGRVYIDSEFNF